MHRRSLLYSLGWFPAIVASVLAAQTPEKAAETGLTVEEIVRLTRAGVAEDVVIAKIKKNAKAFDLSTEELLDLKKYGVTDTVVKFMLDPSQPYSPPPPAGAGTPAKQSRKYPADPFASRIPAEPAFYYISAGAPVKVDQKVLLGAEEAKHFMKKSKTVAYLVSPSAKARLSTTPAPLYLRLAEGKEIQEVLLVALAQLNGRRQLDAGSAASKQQFNAEDIHSFETLEVGPQLFRVTVSKLPPGEYLFLSIGSADPSKGIYGKGYDFGIQEAPKQAKQN